MKTLKRLVVGIVIILIISVCVKCFLVPWLNVRGKRSLDLYYYQSQLVDEDRDLYASILKGVSEQDAVIKLPATTENKMEEITQMILCDHPEIFWIDGSYQYTSYDDKIELEFNYLYEKKEVSGRRKEIQKAASTFTELLSDADKEYNIIQKAYLYVIDTVEDEANSSDNQNVYSSLVNHKIDQVGKNRIHIILELIFLLQFPADLIHLKLVINVLKEKISSSIKNLFIIIQLSVCMKWYQYCFCIFLFFIFFGFYFYFIFCPCYNIFPCWSVLD